MPNYHTSLSSLGSMSVPLQATTHAVSGVNTDGYNSQRVLLEVGPHEQSVHVTKMTKEYDPGPSVINAVFNIEQRAAGESFALGVVRRHAADSEANSFYMRELSRADSVNGLIDEQTRAYESALQGIPKNYVEASNTDLPKSFANLYVTESSHSNAASLIREQDSFIGSILNVVL